MENRKIRHKCWISFLIFLLMIVFSSVLSGCQIVEPEKRAFPLVAGIDWQQGRYEIYLGMARLAESTGQGKEGGEDQKGDEEGALLLTGTSQDEIMEVYHRTQELYLDPGHVQAVIFGSGILGEKERMAHVLEEMETEVSLGNSAYVFGTEDLRAVMETNGNQVESLGHYLSGIYENRTEDAHPITLSQMYRELHNQGKILQIPQITINKEQIVVEKNQNNS